MSLHRMGLVAGLTALGTSPLFAHPGHGTPGAEQSAAHYLSEPVHSLPWMGALVCAAIVAACWIRYRTTRGARPADQR